MIQVKEVKISNEKLRAKFYNIPDAHRLIAVKQLNFIGKIVRREDSFFPKQLLTAWVNHKRKAGGVLTTNKKSLVKALQLLYPPTKFRTDDEGIPCRDKNGKKIPETIYMDRFGSLQYWLEDAMDKKRWAWMIEIKLRSPHLDLPDPSLPNPPIPPRNTPLPQRSQRQRQRQKNENLPPSPLRNNAEYNSEGVGTNLRDSLGILGFNLNEIVTERQVRRRYIELARKYHPDKNVPAKSGRNKEEATNYFQLINNAQQYLQNII